MCICICDIFFWLLFLPAKVLVLHLCAACKIVSILSKTITQSLSNGVCQVNLLSTTAQAYITTFYVCCAKTPTSTKCFHHAIKPKCACICYIFTKYRYRDIWSISYRFRIEIEIESSLIVIYCGKCSLLFSYSQVVFVDFFIQCRYLTMFITRALLYFVRRRRIPGRLDSG